jgi:hypothetical protein
MGEATGSQVQTGGMSMRRERRKPTSAEWRQITSSRPVVRRLWSSLEGRYFVADDDQGAA